MKVIDFKCPFCGTVLVVQKDDAWVTQHVPSFDHAVETSGDMTPEKAVSSALAFFITGLQADPGALWTQELLKTWKQSRAGKTFESPQQEAMSLIVVALYPFHIGGACTVDHALGFFAEAGRRCSDRDLAEAIVLLKPGYDSDRGISEFLAALESRLRGRAHVDGL